MSTFCSTLYLRFTNIYEIQALTELFVIEPQDISTLCESKIKGICKTFLFLFLRNSEYILSHISLNISLHLSKSRKNKYEKRTFVSKLSDINILQLKKRNKFSIHCFNLLRFCLFYLDFFFQYDNLGCSVHLDSVNCGTNFT